MPQSLSLDYYIGRKVEKVHEAKSGGWALELAGGITIHALNDLYEPPDESIVGQALTTVTMSPTETVMVFGDTENPYRVKVNLQPTEYAITDERYGDKAVRPQSFERDLSVPEEPTERVAEGPSEDYRSEKKIREQAEGAEKDPKPKRGKKKG
jgi:hypothetical protein